MSMREYPRLGENLYKKVLPNGLTLMVEDANEIAEAGDNQQFVTEILNSTPGSAIWIMKLSMMILPLILILVGFVLYQKKFKIDEVLYAQIVKDLEERNSEKVEK